MSLDSLLATKTSGAATEEVKRRSPGVAADIYQALGLKIRKRRTELGLTLRDLANTLNISVSFLSQIENSHLKPSIDTLWKIVCAIGISLDEVLVGPALLTKKAPHIEMPDPYSPVVRSRSRKPLRMPDGVMAENLSAKTEPHTDFALATYPSGSAFAPETATCQGQQKGYGYVLAGRLGVAVGDKTYTLNVGDAIMLQPQASYKLWGADEMSATVVWLMLRPHGQSTEIEPVTQS